MSITVKHSPYVFGIDLGTSNSAIAIYKKWEGGKPESRIIPIDGGKTCPSVLNVRDTGEILVGRQARSRLMIDPENTVTSVKREIGGPWTKEFKGLPGKVYTPTDISGEILSKLITGAQQAENVDVKGAPRYVVICIPANFDDTKKTATKAAGALVNLEVLWLLEEPVAAAIAYADEQSRDQTILVYDLGGGTFDVSILKVDSSKSGPAQFTILAKEGVPKLGGDDFDEKIMVIAAEKFKEVSKIDILDLNKDQGITAKSIREAQQKLKDAAEQVKIELGDAQQAQIEIPNLIKDESGELHSLQMEITREQFEAAIRDLILQSREAVQRALDSAKLTIDDISRIILVGGSTRVPLVRQVLTEMFGKEPYGDTDPDTVVARGAAIYGATFNLPEDERDAEERRKGISVTNIATHFLGIETYGGKFNCLIEKGLEIPEDKPLSAEKVYTTPRDNMTELTIRAYQSDSPAELVGTEGVKCIGEFNLTGIPPKPKGQEQISVIFEIDQQNLLKVKAKSSSSSGELEIQRT